jgi:hypothetical protein
MGVKRLKNAADAAGFAMVNPDDFEDQTTLEISAPAPTKKNNSQPTSKSWLTWDYFRLVSGKATA